MQITLNLTDREALILREVLFFSSPCFQTLYLDNKRADIVGNNEYAEIMVKFGLNKSDEIHDVRAHD